MIHARYSYDELKVLRKPDHDGFVMVKRVKDGAMRYVRLTDLCQDHHGELQAALDEAPPWNT